MQEWIDAANKAADALGRSWSTPDLTQAEADEFAKLGQDMQSLVGRPVGITPGQYREFLRQGASYQGLDLRFMLQLMRGDHLKDGKFLKHAS